MNLIRSLFKRGKRKANRQTCRRKPGFEPMEGRRVLASLTVTNLDDYAPGDPPIEGSLRNAIDIADGLPGPDTIRFHPHLRGELALEDQLAVLEGNDVNVIGNHRITLSGQGLHRVLFVDGATVELSRFTIADGVANDASGLPEPVLPGLTLADLAIGGGILSVGGSVTLNRMTIENSQAAGGIFSLGGGIANMLAGQLTVHRSHFRGNSAVGVAVSAGGGIDTDAFSVTHISHSRFEDNSSVALLGGGNPAAFQGAAVGGGVKASGASEMHIEHSYFSGNRSIAGNGDFLPGPLPDGSGQEGGFGAGGGAIGSQALSLFVGVLPDQPTMTTVDRTRIVGNFSLGGRGAAGTAEHPDGFAGGPASAAGIANWGASHMTVTNSYIADNQAIGGAGGDGLSGNGGDGGHAKGAAIENGFSSFGVPVLHVSRSIIKDNQAIGGAGGAAGTGGVVGNGGEALGGAIANATDLLTGQAFGQVHLTRLIVTQNEAIGGTGNLGGDALGGAIYNVAQMDVDRSLIIKNAAIGGEGDTDDGEALEGGIFNDPLGDLDIDFLSELLLRHNEP